MVPPMGQIDLFENCLYSIGQYVKKQTKTKTKTKTKNKTKQNKTKQPPPENKQNKAKNC